MVAAIFVDTEDGTDIHIVNPSGKRTTHCGIPTDGEKQISRYMKRTEFVKHLESFNDATVCTDCREALFEL